MSEQVLNRLEMTRSELLEAVRGLPQETLEAPRPGGGWSVLENLEHLAALEGAIVQGLSAALAGPERADLRRAPLELVKDRTRLVEAPAHVQPAGRIHTAAEAEQAIADVRRRLLEAIAADYGTERMETRGFEHPLFGPMSAAQWVELVPLHEARHLEQIRDTLRRLNDR
ncbi:DinB family protein [Paenibacillus albicereus]|uniref:DinB family protein n=1 Tax=Paenibacillus albicereus TaxID=2726185 RepID=A0A6H2H2R8_9BACL|nr:DinB family protein [Paenibacillus albicereus]QJC53971.1 DinB family protein [Paenibacillus albicereus]